jgi:hypothetical protein
VSKKTPWWRRVLRVAATIARPVLILVGAKGKKADAAVEVVEGLDHALPLDGTADISSSPEGRIPPAGTR